MSNDFMYFPPHPKQLFLCIPVLLSVQSVYINTYWEQRPIVAHHHHHLESFGVRKTLFYYYFPSIDLRTIESTEQSIVVEYNANYYDFCRREIHNITIFILDTLSSSSSRGHTPNDYNRLVTGLGEGKLIAQTQIKWDYTGIW